VSILIGGIGNVFFGDDGFGVAVAQLLARGTLPSWARVVDFGIRGIDLAYALLDPRYEGAVLVDAVRRGHPPGTLSVIEPRPGEGGLEALSTHGMQPDAVLGIVRALGGRARPLRIIGCEPLDLGEAEDLLVGLSDPVEAAVEPGATLALEIASRLRGERAHRA
jgi:hydrogenase maturation protease